MDMASLAALAGNAMVTAAVTDAWEDLRQKVARLFGRGTPDPAIERRLEETRQRLDAASAPDVERVKAEVAGQWRTRFADLLADYPDAVCELDALVREVSVSLSAVADHSAAAGRDMIARADRGGVAANVVHGDVSAGPTKPGLASS